MYSQSLKKEIMTWRYEEARSRHWGWFTEHDQISQHHALTSEWIRVNLEIDRMKSINQPHSRLRRSRSCTDYISLLRGQITRLRERHTRLVVEVRLRMGRWSGSSFTRIPHFGLLTSTFCQTYCHKFWLLYLSNSGTATGHCYSISASATQHQ